MAVAAAHADVQALLRFLTRDAKLSLSDALPKIGPLRKHALGDVEAIAKADADLVKQIFGDDKVAKQVTTAAKRVTGSKKRSAALLTPADPKRMKADDSPERSTDDHLALPTSDLSAAEMADLVVETNRAPLLLAFAVVALKYTMPDQPVSSRLSLAQAMVSANSQSRAKSLGFVKGASAEDEGWAKGQPHVKVLGREIAVLRRFNPTPANTGDSQETLTPDKAYETLWGLDLEALRRSNGPLVADKQMGPVGVPIYTPEGAHAYLMKSVALPAAPPDATATGPPKKLKPGEATARKARAVSMLLKAIDLLCSSWDATLSADELDQRAWSWYVHVRPEVASGRAGWGQKGTVALQDILNLRYQDG